MSPEDVARLSAKQIRYGTSFDVNADQYCPPLVRIKNGNIAKRQPHVREMGTNYWKAQCSFRGLQTSGRIDELKDRMRSRDRSRDAAIKQELDRIAILLGAHYEQKEREDAKRWWQDPSTKLELKIQSDPQRALRLSATLAFAMGLTCQIVEPPQSMLAGMNNWLSWGSWSVIGKADLVQQQVNGLSEQTRVEAQAEQAREDAAREARRSEQRNRHVALVDEAKRQNDWDLTGLWSVQCNELATYSGEEPAKLSMDVYRDDYGLQDVRDPDVDSDDEDYDDEDNPVELQRPKAAGPEEIARVPRFCANFRFGAIDGVMRIYPPMASIPSTTALKISNSPRFEYIWRGRETGESEIQHTADENVLPITFGHHGTSFEATFHCEYLQPVKIIGRKVSHGRGQKTSSAEEWQNLSEKAWNRESRSRW